MNMIYSPSNYISEELALPESYAKMEVIDACYDSINESVATPMTIDTASSYTYSMIIEILDSVKERLLSIYSAVLSQLNNYILNTANIADKYQNLIIDRYDKLEAPIIYRTYSYDKLFDKNYPVIIKAPSLYKDIEDFQAQIADHELQYDQQVEVVDAMLIKFASDVANVTVDPSQLKESIDAAITDMYRGKSEVKTLTKQDLRKFINEITSYKPLKDAVNRTRKSVLDGYNTLKSTYTAAMKHKEALSVGVKSISNPEYVRFNQNDANRFAKINMNMTRLFNGYITIYQEIFNVKLDMLKEKIDSNRAIIVKLLTETNILTAVNTKNPSKARRPLIFDPAIKNPK